MNISPLHLCSNFAIKKNQIINRNCQTQPSFKSLECDKFVSGAQRSFYSYEDGVSLPSISFENEARQVEILSAITDKAFLREQILAIPRLTQRILELIPQEEREEIKVLHDAKFKGKLEYLTAHQRIKEPIGRCNMPCEVGMESIAGNLTPEESFDMITSFEDKNKQIEFLLLEYPNWKYRVAEIKKDINYDYREMSGMIVFKEVRERDCCFVYYSKGIESGIESTRQAIEKLISRDFSYQARLVDILYDIALDEKVSEEDVQNLFGAYIPILDTSHAQKLISKVAPIRKGLV